MIRSSALLIAVAMALLAAGVFASSLELVYISIGISILAAIVLAAGVLLRRGEIFGTAGTARQGTAADWPAADGAGVPAGGRPKTGLGDWADRGHMDSRRPRQPSRKPDLAGSVVLPGQPGTKRLAWSKAARSRTAR